MKPPRDPRDFLDDLVAACRSILAFVDGMSLDAYLSDEKTRYAVMRAYEIMGEAVRHMPPDLIQTHTEIPWRTMSAVRNRIVHGYFGVDDTILFTTIEQDVRPLLPKLEALVRVYATDPPPSASR